MDEGNRVEDLHFKWGKKRGVGGKKKEVQFYESFTYDGVEYALYDCVYLYKDEETEPYIGKIVKIWEHPSKTKRVKVLWFFRPSEIQNHLDVGNVRDNELFMASGEGPGLANVNPLEAIAGKCNVICTSKDSRNPQPSDEEVKMADFVYYRTFDVGHCKILDEIDDKIAGTEVIYLFNRVDPQKPVTEDAAIMTSSHKTCNEDSEMKDTTILHAAAKGNPDSKVSLLKQESSLADRGLSSAGVRLGEKAKKKSLDDAAKKSGDVKATPAIQNLPPKRKLHVTVSNSPDTNISDKDKMVGDQTTMRTEVDSIRSEGKLSKVHAHGPGLERGKNAKEPSELEGRPSKKAKLENSAIISEDKSSFRKTEPADKVAKLPQRKLLKTSPRHSPNYIPANLQSIEVTRKPESGKRKWLKELPWEEKLQNANDQGMAVLLENLDPGYTSAEVEDIIWHAFKESCTAKMIQRTSTSSPHYGRALIIFKTRNVAESVVRKLNEGCLMLPNGRPLVGSFAASCVPAKPSSIPGHLNIDRLKHQMQREMRDAVSTSHCSQPNNIEYDMAMEWCLQHEISVRAWEKLHEKQGEELKKLKAQLKSK